MIISEGCRELYEVKPEGDKRHQSETLSVLSASCDGCNFSSWRTSRCVFVRVLSSSSPQQQEQRISVWTCSAELLRSKCLICHHKHHWWKLQRSCSVSFPSHVNNHTCTRILLIMRADVRMCNKSVACKELRAVLLHKSFPEKFCCNVTPAGKSICNRMGSDMCQIKRAKLLRKRTKKYIDRWEKHSENKKQSTK